MVLISRKPAIAALSEALFARPVEPRPVVREQNEDPEATTSCLHRAQVIERILQINTTTTEAYLAEFSDRALSRYLAHLESMGSPRGARWERPCDSPAIVMRETAF